MGLTAGEAFRGVPAGNARIAFACHATGGRSRSEPRHIATVSESLPMARGGSWMFVRRGTEFCSYHCMVAPLGLEPSLFRVKHRAHT